MASSNAHYNRRYSLDLSGHHAICEMNFHQLLGLLPGLRDGVDEWAFSAGSSDLLLNVAIKVLDFAPYTTTIEIEQFHHNSSCADSGNIKKKPVTYGVNAPRIVIRLYHDVNMAEIVSWDHHRHWKGHYNYPNAKMYHPDEKVALNQFLGEWLNFCLDKGLHATKTVIQFS